MAFVWTDDLSVGIQEIDLQHHHLIDLFGDLERARAKGTDKTLMGGVLRELNTYVREHFSLEERLMSRHDYPGLREHLDQHELFVEKLLHFELDYLGGQEEVSREVLEYLENWLWEHVRIHDQGYAHYFRSIGIV